MRLRFIESIRHFANTPAVLNAHQVILQSEKMKELYVQALLKSMEILLDQNGKENFRDRFS